MYFGAVSSTSQNFAVQLRRQIETLCDFVLTVLRLCVYETFRVPALMSRRTRDEEGSDVGREYVCERAAVEQKFNTA